MNAVISLTCSRGLSAAVPVSGSYAERLSAMLRAPLLNGSKIGVAGKHDDGETRPRRRLGRKADVVIEELPPRPDHVRHLSAARHSIGLRRQHVAHEAGVRQIGRCLVGHGVLERDAGEPQELLVRRPQLGSVAVVAPAVDGAGLEGLRELAEADVDRGAVAPRKLDAVPEELPSIASPVGQVEPLVAQLERQALEAVGQRWRDVDDHVPGTLGASGPLVEDVRDGVGGAPPREGIRGERSERRAYICLNDYKKSIFSVQ